MNYGIKDKRILVTGGAGFIGSHLTDALIREGAKVSIIDNLSTGHLSNINPKAKFYNMSIDSPDVEKVFKKEKPEILFLLACNTIVPKSVTDPLFDIQSLNGNLNMLVGAKKFGVTKVILASSGFVYGNTKVLPTPEKHKIIPDNPYIITKSASENYLQFFNRSSKMDYVILRYATVYGPRQTGGAMADYIRCIKDNKKADIFGDGNKTRDYIYIDDVIKANLLAINFKQRKSVTPIFNIGTGKETTLNNLYAKIAQILKKDSKPNYLPDRAGEMMRFKLSIAKAKKYLKWQPEVELEDGLNNIILK